MTAVQLYKFIQENEIEIGYDDDKPFMFVFLLTVPDLTKMLKGFFDDYSQPCHLNEYYLCVPLEGICDYFEIDLSEIVEPETV